MALGASTDKTADKTPMESANCSSAGARLVRRPQRWHLLEICPHTLLFRRLGQRGLKTIEREHTAAENRRNEPGLEHGGIEVFDDREGVGIGLAA